MVRRLCLLVVALTLAGAGCAYRVDIAAPAAQAETTKVFADDGSLITTLHAEQDREQVPLAQMAAPLKAAVVAIEDERFFDHHGVDVKAMIRAAITNARSGRIVQVSRLLTPTRSWRTYNGTQTTFSSTRNRSSSFLFFGVVQSDILRIFSGIG